MKSDNLTEKIGFVLIIIGFVFLLLEKVWLDNPIPGLINNKILIGSVGLLIWALGRMNREAKEKMQKEIEQIKLDSE